MTEKTYKIVRGCRTCG